MKAIQPLIGITLEGFQVFDKPTYIPLERLTLMFGPNSAGKSAVQDAIELYSKLLLAKNKFRYDDDLDELVKRHWRRMGGDSDCRVEKMALAVTHNTTCNLHDISDSFNRESSEISDAFWAIKTPSLWILENRWYFQRGERDCEKELDFQYVFEFYIESILLVRDNTDDFIVNLAHPILDIIEKNVDFAEWAKSYPNEATLENGLLTIHERIYGLYPSGYSTDQDDALKLIKLIYLTSNEKSEIFRSALAELSLLLGNLLNAANGNTRFQPSVVNASRNVPMRHDLIFQLGNLADQIEPLLPKVNRTYHLLAASLAHLKAPGSLLGWSRDGISSYGERINKALSNHLFIEQGYRIDYDLRVLMSKNNSQAAVNDEELDPDEFGYIVELFLRDGKGRKHLFEDVGSGIGYALPVLCDVYSGDNSIFTPTTSFIQQPELHLHPALQAAMGDVFIEASAAGKHTLLENHPQKFNPPWDEVVSTADKQILIETHSEHLLLRILKRIRQTHLQAAIAPELKINADDVCVLYFDPSPDGTTSVKRLRITEDGEFMDRWPRGFFGERDQELLDE